MPDKPYRSLVITTTSAAYYVDDPPHNVAAGRARAVAAGSLMTLTHGNGETLAGERFYLNPAMLVAILPAL